MSNDPVGAVILRLVRSPLMLVAYRSLALALFPALGVSLAYAPQGMDPRCGDRTAVGRFTCTINQPNVRKRLTPYSNVVFAPGDNVRVSASGCVQTGGFGPTWKRYVNPSGPDSDHLYHGLIRIPSATPGSGPTRIKDVIGRNMVVSGAGLPPSELILSLGYEDDDYGDNGYNDHDDGTEDQCKGIGAAQVSIVIVRTGATTTPTPTPSDKFDFNLEWTALAPGGFPLNPQWTWQRKHPGQIPDSALCHNFSKVVKVGTIPVLVPDFADCTDQTDLSHVDTPDGWNAFICSQEDSNGFHGHVNWFAATFDGNATWGDHNTDDDYYIALESSGVPALVNKRGAMHTEFDSDETIDNFQSSWWIAFHSAIDHGLGKSTLNGQHTIMTGLFGLDCEHNCKSELHPVYAMATNIIDDPADDLWGMFVRNAGDEGYCSRQIWEAPFTTYTFRLPWRAGMDSVEVLSGPGKTQFAGTEGTSGPTVTFTRGQGVDVTFTLPPPSATPLIDGALHLRWSGQPTVRGRQPAGSMAGRAESGRPQIFARPPVAGMARGAERDDDAERRIRAAIDQLPPPQRRQVNLARTVARTRTEMHPLPPVGPARRVIAFAAAPRAAVRLGAKGPVATRKLERDAAQIRALCAAFSNSPPGLPASVCTSAPRRTR
ncbi:MAG TPA: hypothetical protein VHE60_11850 [Pyrinomonadaceae bacterium]|nr:hypothetical protein [Pyrinomonadaceae bacterium]